MLFAVEHVAFNNERGYSERIVTHAMTFHICIKVLALGMLAQAAALSIALASPPTSTSSDESGLSLIHI